ncbi:MAG: hypothetical protein VKJ46_11835, partial [Leptolyngbyaceae bacterium]|nr:hypothetical protein [Leptolyngbyaceae bacterium]
LKIGVLENKTQEKPPSINPSLTRDRFTSIFSAKILLTPKVTRMISYISFKIIFFESRKYTIATPNTPRFSGILGI